MVQQGREVQLARLVQHVVAKKYFFILNFLFFCSSLWIPSQSRAEEESLLEDYFEAALARYTDDSRTSVLTAGTLSYQTDKILTDQGQLTALTLGYTNTATDFKDTSDNRKGIIAQLDGKTKMNQDSLI